MTVLDSIQEHMRSGLGLSVRTIDTLGVTAYNGHYRVHLEGDEGDLHLVVYNLPEELPLGGIRFEHEILRYLGQAGFSQAPRLVTSGDESLFSVDGAYYALTEWIDGCHSELELPLNDQQLAACGETLAAFHAATDGFEGRLDYFPEHVFVYTTPHFLDAWPELFAALPGRAEAFGEAAAAAVGPFMERARPFLEGFDRQLWEEARAADPTRLVHGDYRRLNIVFGPDSVRKVLDFNCCFHDLRLWDVVYGAFSYGGKETVGPIEDADAVSAFIRAYHQASPLTDLERRLLPDYLCFVMTKLITAAFEGWGITDRVDSLARLLDGQAHEIVDGALPNSD